MEINFYDILIYISISLVAFFLSLTMLGRIARVIFDEYSKKFDEQIDLYKKYTDQALGAHIKDIANRQDFKLNIIQNFEKVNEEMISFDKNLKHLNLLCDTRKELEHEIIKLKKILARKEKKI